jgi:Zn-dependent M28 family amino/carboxypeptidase
MLRASSPAIWAAGFAAALVFANFSTYAQETRIDGNRIKAHTRFLSLDLLEGRGVGTKGEDITTAYIASQLEAAGAKPAGDKGTYFQSVPLQGVKTLITSRLSFRGKSTLDLKWQDEFVAGSHRQTPSESIDADVVFAGHGISSPQDKWNDYKDSVKGKVVIVFTNEPQPDNPQVFKGRTLTYAGRWIYKFEEALRQGAVGCLIVHTTPTAGYGWQVVRNSWAKEDPQIRLAPGAPALGMAGWITEEAGQKLFATIGKSVEEMLKLADSPDFRPMPLPVRVRADLKSELRPIQSKNVVAMVPGSDPKLKDEYVIFTAHWDHLGVGFPVNGDSIYNGAVDNATGVAVVIETARAWAALDPKPKKSALFLLVTAEEAGLRGSEYYGQNPIVPPGKSAVNINYDALFPFGRTKDIVLLGAERTTFWNQVQQAAQRYNFEISPDPRPEQGSYYRSDHFMLARVGIPAFSVKMGTQIAGKSREAADEVFLAYNSKNYHQPSDEFREDWDFSGIEHAARFGMLLGVNAANTEKLPTWQAGDEFLPARQKSGVQ